jgi:hypothetical protein
MHCIENLCVHEQPTPGAKGSSCRVDRDCNALGCAGLPELAVPVCAVVCHVADGTGCAWNESCLPRGTDDGIGFCLTIHKAHVAPQRATTVLASVAAVVGGTALVACAIISVRRIARKQRAK